MFHRTFLRRFPYQAKPNPRVFPTPNPPQRAIVLGSSGALGRSIVEHLSSNGLPHILGVDVRPDPTVPVTQFWNVSDATRSLQELTQSLVRGVKDFTSTSKNNNDDGTSNDSNHTKLDLLICAAGGWAGDPSPLADTCTDTASVDQHIAEYATAIDTMRRVNLEPALAMAYLVQNDRYLHLPSHPLCVFFGATAALQPTPGMLGYGLSKTSIHHTAQTVACGTSNMMLPKTKEHGVLDDRLTILTLCPSVLDTPGNAGMKGSMIKTPVDDIARQIVEWTKTPALRPHSGALVKVVTTREKKGGDTEGNPSSNATNTLFQIVR